jgi:hypothetical protein
VKLTTTTQVSVDGVVQGNGARDENRSGGFERGGWARPLFESEAMTFVDQVYQRADAGASEEARRVKIMNANWIAGAHGDDGDFELMIVTSDYRKHVVAPSPAAMTALVALAQADTVLVWDPADRRLIAANLRGTMPWTEDPAPPGT